MESVNRLELLKKALAKKGATQLGVGPMSEACVNAVIELANEHRHPLMLIASRRQIECKEQGGGYVNGWTTESFAEYVRSRDRGGYVLLCRDHGGPWQNYPEVAQKMSVVDAMQSAKRSFEVDIQAGFDVIHIDPSMPPASDPPTKTNVLELLFELYDFVTATAGRLRRRIAIEVGTEEQNGNYNSPEELGRFLSQLKTFCGRRAYEMPVFVVAQTGTLVKETKNVGLVKADRKTATQDIAALVEVAAEHGVFVKEHNGDYLEDQVLALRPKMGVGATNIAPEFGVEETRFLLETCEASGLEREAEAFLDIAYKTKKWEKWMLPNTTATDRDRAIMAGHYAFGLPEFKRLFERMRAAHDARGVDLSRAMRDHLKAAILRTARPMRICVG
jgi:tagatose-6-phosphate kinase